MSDEMEIFGDGMGVPADMSIFELLRADYKFFRSGACCSL